MSPNDEEPFDYVESYYTGYNWRYASATLYRNFKRTHWTDGFHMFVTDDFGFLKHVGYTQ